MCAVEIEGERVWGGAVLYVHVLGRVVGKLSLACVSPRTIKPETGDVEFNATRHRHCIRKLHPLDMPMTKAVSAEIKRRLGFACFVWLKFVYS